MPAAAMNATALNAARAFFEAYNAHDVDRMIAACTRDAELRYPPLESQEQGKVREAGRKTWSGLMDAFPDLTVRIRSMFGDDRNVAAEVVIGGTQRKDFMQVRNQGKHYEVPLAFLLQVDSDGLIAGITAYWDNATFFRQLGKTTLDS